MTMRMLAPGILLLAPALLHAQRPNPKAQICLAPAQVESTIGAADDAVNAIREGYTTYLAGPSLFLTPLAARLEVQARAEAKTGKCEYLLLTSVKHTRKGGGNGFLGRMAGSAIQQGVSSVAGSMGSTAGRLAAGVVSGAAGAAAYNYAGSTKMKDEVTLGYRLETASGEVLQEKSGKQKASSDGEDLLTPLIAKASEAIARLVLNRLPLNRG